MRLGTTGQRDDDIRIETKWGIFHFILFETRRMDNAVTLVTSADLFQTIPYETKTLCITGGGALKFSSLFEGSSAATDNNTDNVKSKESRKEGMGLRLKRVDEMRSLIVGLNFLLKHMDDECFYYPIPISGTTGAYDDLSNVEKKFVNVGDKDIFPYLLVNIGYIVYLISHFLH